MNVLSLVSIGLTLIFIGLLITVIYLMITYDERHTKSMQIYIAGKYSGSPEEIKQHVKDAEAAGMQVADKCNYPLVPHLLGYMSQENHTYVFWTYIDDIALKKSDALLIISHSKGADAELALAKQLHKPIYYSIDEVPNRCD